MKILVLIFNTGGVLSGKHKYEQVETNQIQKGRFAGNSIWAQKYRDRFWQKSYFDAIDLV